MSATIYDVARAAGVAPSTVSRAFARPGRVNAETAERIRRAAAELGYRTAPPARTPPPGRSSMLALVLSDITNPVWFDVIQGAQAAAADAGYTVLLTDAQESGDREREALQRTLPTVEGVVLATPRMPDAAIRAAARQRPVVVLNRVLTDLPCVVADNRGGMRRAVEHLAALGHRRLAYAAGPAASWADAMRWYAVRSAAADLGLAARRLGTFAPVVAGGAGAASALSRGPAATAVLAYNDLMAIGIIRALSDAGVRVPQDVSVVGFDNIFAAELVAPALTTVAAPLRAMGFAAVRNLLANARGAAHAPNEPLTLPARLVVRASTGPAPR